MIEKFGEDVNKNVTDELRKSYPPYSDSFILNVIKPPVEKFFRVEYSMPGTTRVLHKVQEEMPEKDLEAWYHDYQIKTYCQEW